MSYLKSLFLFKAQGKGSKMDYKKVGGLHLYLFIFTVFCDIFTDILESWEKLPPSGH